MKITELRARQIFDSRGVPTLEVRAALEDGSAGVGSAPSGASTGSHEAQELRDGGEAYGGKGVRRAVDGVNGPIRAALTGMDAADQCRVDERRTRRRRAPACRCTAGWAARRRASSPARCST